MDVYREDLAYIPDRGYTAPAEDATARLVEEFARLGRLPTAVFRVESFVSTDLPTSVAGVAAFVGRK